MTKGTNTEKAKDLYSLGMQYELTGEFSKAEDAYKNALDLGLEKASKRLKIIRKALGKFIEEDIKWSGSEEYTPVVIDEREFDEDWLAKKWTEIYNTFAFHFHGEKDIRNRRYRAKVLKNYEGKDILFEVDWWGFVIVHLKHDADYRLIAELNCPKESKLDPNRTTLFIDPPWYGYLDLNYINPVTFEYLNTTAENRFKFEKARMPIGSIAIMKLTETIGFGPRYVYKFFHLIAHHTGLIPIKKSYATDVLRLQLLDFVKRRRKLPKRSMIQKLYQNDSMDISLDLCSSAKKRKELVFTIKIQPDMLDDITRPIFKQLSKENS